MKIASAYTILLKRAYIIQYNHSQRNEVLKIRHNTCLLYRGRQEAETYIFSMMVKRIDNVTKITTISKTEIKTRGNEIIF